MSSIDILQKFTGFSGTINNDPKDQLITTNTPKRDEDIPIINIVEDDQDLSYLDEVLPGYSNESKRSILRGLKQEGTIDRGSFIDYIGSSGDSI
jgi:hypothetical protein